VKFLAGYIMQGRIQAMLVASTLAVLSLIVPPISIVSSATVALVTLRAGALEGLLVLVSSCLAAAILGSIVINNFQFAAVYGVVLWLPVWLISIVLREGRHLSLAVEISVLLGILGIIAFYQLNSEPADIWINILSKIKPLADMQDKIPLYAHFTTGVVAAGTVFTLLFGLFLGRWWQALLYNPGGFSREYKALSTKPRMAIGSLLVILVAVYGNVGSETAWNIIVALFVFYAFIGTAVAHCILATKKRSRLYIGLLYGALFLIPQAMLITAVIGLIDPWLHFRNNISS
jgi:hypothetical protein